jgi:hypothetical protein
MICTTRILRQQKRTFEQIYSIYTKQEHSPPLRLKLSPTFAPHVRALTNHENTRSMNHRLSFRVWYVGSSHLPYGALLSLDGINACLPLVALAFLLLQHTPAPTIPLTAHDERYDGYPFEILFAFPFTSIPITHHYY